MASFRPDDVFKPRSSEVNPTLYITRPELELELTEALTETHHILIHGESGNGKSWLYKRVFRDQKVFHVVVNLVQASRLGSLSAAFRDIIERQGRPEVESREVLKTAKLSPYSVGFEGAEKRVLRVGKKEPYEALLEWVSQHKASRHVVILDNFEQIANDPKLCKEVSDCVILLDDPNYSRYKVKLCIVGVPRDIDDILSAHGNVATISSRLREISEVERMTEREAKLLMQIGLERLLQLDIDFDSEDFYAKILWLTDRIALELQEFGLRLAKEAERNKKKIGKIQWNRAVELWARGSLKAYCSAVSMRLNSRETKISRRNQCIFAIGKIERSDFTYRDIEAIIRSEFPSTTEGVALNVSGELSKLSKGENPIIKRLPNGEAYRLASPKYRMAIRTMLENEGGRLVKASWSRDHESV